MVTCSAAMCVCMGGGGWVVRCIVKILKCVHGEGRRRKEKEGVSCEAQGSLYTYITCYICWFAPRGRGERETQREIDREKETGCSSTDGPDSVFSGACFGLDSFLLSWKTRPLVDNFLAVLLIVHVCFLSILIIEVLLLFFFKAWPWWSWWPWSWSW